MGLTKIRTKTRKKSTTAASRMKLAPKPPKATSDPGAGASRLRERLMLTQAQFAPMLAVSIRSLATLEAGIAPTAATKRRLTELARLTQALSEVVDKKAIGTWLQTPNQAFQGLKPVEVIERGETDRIWEMIHALRSGVAS